MDLTYTDFKNKLATKQRWIARAIMVLTYNPHDFDLDSVTTDLFDFAKVIQLNGGRDLPFRLDSKDGKHAIWVVSRYAPRLFKYSKLKQQAKREMKK